MKRQNKRHRKVRKCVEGPNFSGQHLLHNKRIIAEMIEIAEVRETDTIFEIGAGKGVLTLPLAEKAEKVLAVENDPGFIEVLRDKSRKHANITIIPRDIRETALPREAYSVVANIPYSITTAILGKLLDTPSALLQKALLMVEKGAAKRFTSTPVVNARILTWRMWFELKLVREVPRHFFSPPPRVDSALLRIRRRKQPLVPHNQHLRFRAMADYGLKHPRLPISEALLGIFTPPQIKHLVKNIGADRNSPICSLNEEQWATVFMTMLRHVEPFRWPKGSWKRK